MKKYSTDKGGAEGRGERRLKCLAAGLLCSALMAGELSAGVLSADIETAAGALRAGSETVAGESKDSVLSAAGALRAGSETVAGESKDSSLPAADWEERFSEVAIDGSGEQLILTAAKSWTEDILPERYDPREQGKVPVVKSQGSLGTCWALTVTSVLEAALMPEEHLVFSADHMSLNNGFHITQNEGGDYMMAMAYLSGWYGPVLEEEDPYGDGYSPEGLKARVHVQEMQLLEGLNDWAIKQLIYDYGPVQTSLYLDRRTTSSALDYYNKETFAYYYPKKETPSHDVLVLGWDDHFPKENFARQPEADGAYICQNSWGEKFADKGIFYVSYEDANILGGGVAYTKVEGTDNYDAIYQTDVCGWQGQQGYETESCYFANVYTSEQDEQLEAVGFYATDVNSSYEVYVVEDFADTTSFDLRRRAAAGRLNNSGYYTVPLDRPVELEEGQRFAVMVKIKTPGATKPVAVELHKDIYSDTVTLDGKEGYLSMYGDAWEFTEEKFGTNVCLKAYTLRR